MESGKNENKGLLLCKFAQDVEIQQRENKMESAWIEILMQVRKMAEKEQVECIGLIAQYKNGYFGVVELIEHLIFIDEEIQLYANIYFREYTHLHEYKKLIK